ncbi:hypothetical protein D3C71_1660600 [compost metagenome]
MNLLLKKMGAVNVPYVRIDARLNHHPAVHSTLKGQLAGQQMQVIHADETFGGEDQSLFIVYAVYGLPPVDRTTEVKPLLVCQRISFKDSKPLPVTDQRCKQPIRRIHRLTPLVPGSVV